jgi:hypothetical protein
LIYSQNDKKVYVNGQVRGAFDDKSEKTLISKESFLKQCSEPNFFIDFDGEKDYEHFKSKFKPHNCEEETRMKYYVNGEEKEYKLFKFSNGAVGVKVVDIEDKIENFNQVCELMKTLNQRHLEGFGNVFLNCRAGISRSLTGGIVLAGIWNEGIDEVMVREILNARYKEALPHSAIRENKAIALEFPLNEGSERIVQEFNTSNGLNQIQGIVSESVVSSVLQEVVEKASSRTNSRTNSL